MFPGGRTVLGEESRAGLSPHVQGRRTGMTSRWALARPRSPGLLSVSTRAVRRCPTPGWTCRHPLPQAVWKHCTTGDRTMKTTPDLSPLLLTFHSSTWSLKGNTHHISVFLLAPPPGPAHTRTHTRPSAPGGGLCALLTAPETEPGT